VSPGAERYRAALRRRGLETDEEIGGLLRSAAALWPNREAVVFGTTRLTFAGLHRWSERVAADLVQAGVSPGDRILWQVPNSLEGLVLHLAGWRIGAVCVPVVPLYREHEMAHIIGDSQPAAVAFSTRSGGTRSGGRRPVDEMQVLLDRLGVRPLVRYAVGEAVPGWSSLPQAPGTDDPPPAGLPEPGPAHEPCLVLYTSGTTSAPKGVMHSSRSLIAEARTIQQVYGLSPADTFLMGAPITHIAGLLCALVLPAAIGARTALLPGWDPDMAVRVAHEERATFCQGATVFLRDLVDRYEKAGPELHRLSLFMCGGSAIPPSLIERADAAGVKAWRAWGMTEAPTTAFSTPDDPLERRAHTEGRPSPGTEIQAVDPGRGPLPPGETGELRVRSPEQMLGYTDPALTAEQVDDEGWFYSGDVGYVDSGGWLVMTGRLKDIINRGGEKFSAQDIEQVVGSHPAIASVAVVGRPDERLGECVVAFVVLADGARWPGAAELTRHLEQAKLARQKFPVAWYVVDRLPMTLSGKVQKHKLAAPEYASCERRD